MTKTIFKVIFQKTYTIILTGYLAINQYHIKVLFCIINDDPLVVYFCHDLLEFFFIINIFNKLKLSCHMEDLKRQDEEINTKMMKL